MKITVLKSANGGVAFYRAIQPYTQLQGEFDIFMFDPDQHHPWLLYQHMEASDVIVYQMPWGRAIAETIEKNKKRITPKKIVVEYDDNIFNVSPFNNAYAKFGTEEIQNTFFDAPSIEHVSKSFPKVKPSDNTINHIRNIGLSLDNTYTIDQWKDGERDFDLKRNIDDAEYTKYIVANADVVTCTTMELGKQLRKYRPKGEIVILPNLVDVERFLPMKENDTGTLRIGWQGGDAHFLDLLQIMPALDKVFAKHKNLKFVTMGGYFPSLFKTKEFEGRYEHIQWHGDINTYPLAVRDMKCDIMIAPLIKDKFNDCKSELKWLEYSLLKAPGVYSDVVYSNEVKHTRTGLIACSVDDWEKHLNQLVESPELRKDIADRAYTRVSKYRGLEQVELYKQMLLSLKTGIRKAA